MQTTMSVDTCAECGQPVRSGEPAMQTASVDIIDGRAVASPVTVLPHGGRLLRRRQATEASRRSRIDGSA